MTSTEERSIATITEPTVTTTDTVPVLPRGAVDLSAQPRVHRNDYSVVDVPELGEWTPKLSVSVVIPAYGGADKLALVLASLAAQSYPAHHMEVIVVDDGSPEPLTCRRSARRTPGSSPRPPAGGGRRTASTPASPRPRVR